MRHALFTPGLLVLLGALLPASWARAQAVTPIPSPAYAPEKNKLLFDSQLKRAQFLRSAGSLAPDDAIHFDLQDGDLSFTTSMSQGPMRSFRIKGVEGIGSLSSMNNRRFNGYGGLSINFFEQDKPQYDVAETIISGINSTLSLMRILMLPDGKMCYVRLQQSQFQLGGAGIVGLYVTDTLGSKPVTVNATAESTTQLIHKYPRESIEFIKPMFDELKINTELFGVNADVAWQVLGGAVTPDAGTVAKVNATIARLADDSYDEREKAVGDLQQIGRPAVVYLTQHPPKNLRPEQAARVNAFLLQYRPLSVDEAKSLARDKAFLLDCLRCDDAHIPAIALEQLKAVTRTKIAFDPSLSLAERYEAVDALRVQLFPPATQPGQ